MIWIIGEYAERIDNADELLESFLESFPEEPAQVQLQLLTATVKLFLKKPTEGPQQMIQVCCLTFPGLFMTCSLSEDVVTNVFRPEPVDEPVKGSGRWVTGSNRYRTVMS